MKKQDRGPAARKRRPRGQCKRELPVGRYRLYCVESADHDGPHQFLAHEPTVRELEATAGSASASLPSADSEKDGA